MSGFSLNAREAARVSVDLLKQKDVPPSTRAEVEPTQVVTAFDLLQSRNPALKLLIATLDLEEVGHQQILSTSGPQEDSARRPAVVNVAKLNTLAESTFDEGASYTEDEAVACLASSTRVSTDRARNGFALLLEYNILTKSAANTYFLTNSIPF